jgi:hypothetical protein
MDILKKIIYNFQKLSTNMHINELFKLTNRAHCGYILDPTFYFKFSIF